MGQIFEANFVNWSWGQIFERRSVDFWSGSKLVGGHWLVLLQSYYY